MVITMKEVNITIIINDEKISEKKKKKKEKLYLKNNDEEISFNIKEKKLTKTNNDLKITIDFKNETIDYELIKENHKFSNNFTVLSLTNNDKEYIINYQIEEQKFLLQINYETL